jgi:hypothetical protein
MKKQVIVVALTLGLSLMGATKIAAQDGVVKVVDTIAASSLKPIQTALPEFTRWRLNLDGYASSS